MSQNKVKISDRIKEISYTMGTGNFALNGAVAGFSSFGSAYSNNDSLFYAITDGTRYEVGSGLFKTGSNNYIVRFPLKSSNSNNHVDFPEGIKEVFVTYPATHAVYMGSGIDGLSTPSQNGIAFWSSSNTLDYDSSVVWDKTFKALGINNPTPDYGIHLGGIGPQSIVKASGFMVGSSGVYFPPSNDYAGGVQFTHYEKNKLDNQALSEGKIGQLTGTSAVFDLSGVANQYILFKPQNAGLVFAGPPSGCVSPCSPAYPTFRQLTIDDVPGISSLSGILNNKMFTLIGTTNSAIVSVSGLLNTKINTVSGILSANQGIPDGDKGDILVTNTGTTWTIDANAINSTKLANSSVTPQKVSFNKALTNIVGGRLTLTSNTPVTSSDATSSIVYYTPYVGSSICLYNTSSASWDILDFTQASLSLSGLTSGKNYDVFAYNNNGTLTLELGTAWSTDTTRATNLSTQDGVYVLSGNLSRRYLGTIRATASNTTEDSQAKRFVWNMYNRVNRSLRILSAAGPWTYNGTSWRLLNAASYPVEVVQGLFTNSVSLNAGVLFTAAQTSPTVLYSFAIAKDSTSTPFMGTRISNINDATNEQLSVTLFDNPGLGYHYYTLLEKGNGAVASAYALYGANSSDYFGGIQGSWEC